MERYTLVRIIFYSGTAQAKKNHQLEILIDFTVTIIIFSVFFLFTDRTVAIVVNSIARIRSGRFTL